MYSLLRRNWSQPSARHWRPWARIPQARSQSAQSARAWRCSVHACARSFCAVRLTFRAMPCVRWLSVPESSPRASAGPCQLLYHRQWARLPHRACISACACDAVSIFRPSLSPLSVRTARSAWGLSPPCNYSALVKYALPFTSERTTRSSSLRPRTRAETLFTLNPLRLGTSSAISETV